MNRRRLLVSGLLVGLLPVLCDLRWIPADDDATPAIHVAVVVDRSPDGERPGDEFPVEFPLNLPDRWKGRSIDPGSLRITRPGSSSAESLPLRWYDAAVPYEFPECEQNIHATDGKTLVTTRRLRWGDFYNVVGEGHSGRLVWMHREDGRPAEYAITFRLLPPGVVPVRCAPRGWTGDGACRCAPAGAGTTGMIHSRVALADWNADGLTDLLVGGARGQVLFYPNLGTPTEPRYESPRLVVTADGLPLDVGWSAAPLAVDWNEDGRLDLLCGAERNRVVWYENTGSASAPRLELRGFVRVAGEPLELPVTPVPKSPEGVYTLDYYPVLEVVDWTGDGRPDLLAGGYVTGRIYLFENLGREPDQTPRLVDRGPLVVEDDSGVTTPLNVGDWAAAPCAADWDGDGDLDLMSGNMAMTAGGGDSSDREHGLRYYENTGSALQPRLVERPFPRQGDFPALALATPRTGDLDGDGRLDLAVSAGENISLWWNRGERNSPRWVINSTPLPGPWSSAPLPTWGLQVLDVDGTGGHELLSGLTLYHAHNDGRLEARSLLPAGDQIEHPSPRGDAWIFTQLADLTGDGQLDLLYGTHEGHVWLHARSGADKPGYDLAGRRLMLQDGAPLQVGPRGGQAVDFDVLQGARTTFAVADFNSDGRLDLVVGDTYGKVRLFLQESTGTEPVYLSPILVGDLKIRLVPCAVDWNGDGQIDILAASAAGSVVWYQNQGGGRFAGAEKISMPEVPYSPFATAVDWNQDGDIDLVVGTSYGYSCWFERSFLERGYRVAREMKQGSR